MTRSRRTDLPTRRRGSPARAAGPTAMPVLLLVSVAALALAVGGIAIVGHVGAVWSVVLALALAVSGLMALMVTLERQMSEREPAPARTRVPPRR